MDLIHPTSKADVADALRTASEDGTRVSVVGGRRHIGKGNPCEVDAEIWTTQLDSVVSYEPAEMVAVVGAGMRFGDLDRLLSDRGQEWPADAPADATVGGIIAAAANSPRRLKTGPLRDTVLEVEMVTGDGRHIRGGARTMKNVTGYDLPRLVTGSLGTLGVLVQVAIRLRPRAKARRVLTGAADLDLARRLLRAVPMPASVLATPDRVQLLLEGWPGEVDAQTDAALGVTRALETSDDSPFPRSAPWDEEPVVVEAAVAPSRLPELASAAGRSWGALLGVGLLWAGLGSDGRDLKTLRRKAQELGGIAPVIRGAGGLGETHSPAREVQERLKRAFDPAGILAPGRGWAT